MTDELKAERGLFEKWALQHLCYAPINYKNNEIRRAWEAWKARAKLDHTNTTGGDGDE